MSFLLLLTLAWLYVLARWTEAHADELGRGLKSAMLPWLVLIGMGVVAALLLLGFVIAAIYSRWKPRK